jgi:nuclear GTP-binding protein
MVLNDWIRGKIPFFVPPPNTSVDLNREKKKSKAGETDVEDEGPVTELDDETREVMEAQEKMLGKVLGEKRVKGVQQGMKGIITVNKFMAEDRKKHEEDEEMEEGSAADDDDEEEEEVEEEEEEEEVEEEAGELAWEDIFPGKAGSSSKAAAAAPASIDEISNEDEDEDDEDQDEDDAEPAQSSKKAGKGMSRTYSL